MVAPSWGGGGKEGGEGGGGRGISCTDVCSAMGKRCYEEDMWWALAVPNCALVDALLRAYGDEDACRCRKLLNNAAVSY